MTRITPEHVREALKNKKGGPMLFPRTTDDVIARMRAAGLFDPPGAPLTLDEFRKEMERIIDEFQGSGRDWYDFLYANLTPLLAPCEDLRPTMTEVQKCLRFSDEDYIAWTLDDLFEAGFIKPDPTPPMPEFSTWDENAQIEWLDERIGFGSWWLRRVTGWRAWTNAYSPLDPMSTGEHDTRHDCLVALCAAVWNRLHSEKE